MYFNFNIRFASAGKGVLVGGKKEKKKQTITHFFVSGWFTAFNYDSA